MWWKLYSHIENGRNGRRKKVFFLPAEKFIHRINFVSQTNWLINYFFLFTHSFMKPPVYKTMKNKIFFLLFVLIGRVTAWTATTWNEIAFATLSLLIDYRIAWLVWWTISCCCSRTRRSGCCSQFSYLNHILIGMNVHNLFVFFVVVGTDCSSICCEKLIFSWCHRILILIVRYFCVQKLHYFLSLVVTKYWDHLRK